MKMKSNKLQLAILAALASQAPLLVNTASAQPALQEIVITSTRRETNVQDTALSVTAITAEALEEQNIENVQDLTAVVPNVLIRGNRNGVSQGTAITMRGIPNVGVYIDGVWQVSSGGLLQRQFVELDRIEVLRGPQGTLIGRDSTGGSIQMFTQKPNEEFGADVKLGIGSFDRRDVSASIDVPITDTLLTKWTLADYDKDGYVESVTTGQNHGELQNQIFRGDILWTPTDDLSVRYIRQQDDQSSTTAGVQTFINPQVAYDFGWQVGIAEAHDIASLASGGRGFNCQSTVAGCAGGDLGEYQNTKLQRSPDEQEVTSNTLLIDYFINDNFSLKYIYGDTDAVSSLWTDYAGSEFNFFTNYDINVTDYSSHEIQLNFDFDRFTAVLGAFAWEQEFRERRVEWSHSDWIFADGWGGGAGGSIGGPPVPPGTFQTRNSGRQQTLDYDDVLASPTCTTQTPADTGNDFEGTEITDDAGNVVRVVGAADTTDGWIQRCGEFDAWVPLFSTVVGFNSTDGIDGSDRSNLLTQEGYAIFGEITYGFTDRWDVTAGFRYHEQENEAYSLDIANGKLDGSVELRPITWDRGFSSESHAVNGAIIPSSLTDAEFNKTTYRFATSYDINDNIMAYIGYSEGFNAGGFSIVEDSLGRNPLYFDPETIENWELGMRADFMDGRLRVNATLFNTDWVDIQIPVSQIDRGTGRSITETGIENAAKGEAKGLELEVNFAATENLILGANLGFLDTQYKDIDDGAQITLDTEFGGAPDQTANLNAQYDWNLNGGSTLTGYLAANYWGRYWRSEVPSYRQDAYGGNSMAGDFWVVNARVVFTPSDANYQVSVYGNNLTDSYNINSGFMDSIWQFDFAGVDAPREYGITMQMSF